MTSTLTRTLALTLLSVSAARAQKPAPPTRITGVDLASHIAYALISTFGTLPETLTPAPPPRLTAQ